MLLKYTCVQCSHQEPYRCEVTINHQSFQECGEPAKYRYFWSDRQVWVCEKHAEEVASQYYDGDNSHDRIGLYRESETNVCEFVKK